MFSGKLIKDYATTIGLTTIWNPMPQSDNNVGCLSSSKDISIWRPSLESRQITTSKGCKSPGRSQQGRPGTLTHSLPPPQHTSSPPRCSALLMKATQSLESACFSE